jgi:alpha-tubulin suppressor-like RCC1 family protein
MELAPARGVEGEDSCGEHGGGEEEENPFMSSMAQPSYAYLWGYGGWGALGMGTGYDDADEDDDTYDPPDLERPTLLRSPALDGMQLRQIVCTKRHTLFLTGTLLHPHPPLASPSL